MRANGAPEHASEHVAASPGTGNNQAAIVTAEDQPGSTSGVRSEIILDLLKLPQCDVEVEFANQCVDDESFLERCLDACKADPGFQDYSRYLVEQEGVEEEFEFGHPENDQLCDVISFLDWARKCSPSLPQQNSMYTAATPEERAAEDKGEPAQEQAAAAAAAAAAATKNNNTNWAHKSVEKANQAAEQLRELSEKASVEAPSVSTPISTAAAAAEPPSALPTPEPKVPEELQPSTPAVPSAEAEAKAQEADHPPALPTPNASATGNSTDVPVEAEKPTEPLAAQEEQKQRDEEAKEVRVFKVM